VTQTEIVLTVQQKVLIGLLTAVLSGIATGALGIAWNTREMVKSHEARLDQIDSTRFTEADGLLMIETIRQIVRDEIDRSVAPLKEDINEMKGRLPR